MVKTNILNAADTICGECSGTEEDCEKCYVRAICDDVLGHTPKNRYCVTLSVTGYYTAHVTASNEQEAVNLAQDMYHNCASPKLETAETSPWEVIKEES